MADNENDAVNEYDDVSGTKTTGHDWDGIRELDTPMPRWWLNTFYITVIWGIGYMIFYPAIPLVTSYTKGLLNYSSRGELAESLDQAAKSQEKYTSRLKTASLDEIRGDEDLFKFAVAGGEAAYKINCVQCHGSGASGLKGSPNLNDDDWLWGGKLEDIYVTIKHGIRFESDDDTRFSEMPAFGRDELLTDDQITWLTKYVKDLSSDKPQTSGVAHELFLENCASCHGDKGQGDRTQGAPALNDQISLYGDDLSAIRHTIYNSRGGVMPAWHEKLDDTIIKQLAIYIHALGGGE